MKYFLFFFICFSFHNLNGQACGPNNWSQDDIDNFNVNFPGCTVLENLALDFDVTNVDSLYAVTKIEGFLVTSSPSNNNPNLSGLINLDSIMGPIVLFDGHGSLPSVKYIGGYLSHQGAFVALPELNYVNGNVDFSFKNKNISLIIKYVIGLIILRNIYN
jgi:hypothetical protein